MSLDPYDPTLIFIQIDTKVVSLTTTNDENQFKTRSINQLSST